MADSDEKVSVPNEWIAEFLREGGDAFELGVEGVRAIVESPDQGDRITDQTKARLEATRKSLADINSMFPATQEFLRERGINHVDELDAEGQRDLVKHLQDTLSLLTSDPEGQAS